MNGITAAISNMQQGQVGQQIGMAVARKSLDAMKAQGQAALSLLDQAAEMQQQMIRAEPHKGTMIDVIA